MKAKQVAITLLTIVLLSCSLSNGRIYQGYIEGENIYLASPNSGILEKLLVQRGQQVTKGQLLFSLDPNPQALIIQQHESDLLQAKSLLQDLKNPRRVPEIEAIEAQIDQVDAQLRLAELRVQRYQQLYKNKAVEKDRLDEAIAILDQQKKLKAQYEANLDLAKLGGRTEQIKAQEAQIQAILTRLKEAKWQLDQKSIYSPADGQIFDTYYRTGEFVGVQQPVVSLLTPTNVYIEFFVPVEELSQLQIGQTIDFTCPGCSGKQQASVSYISPEAEFTPPLVYSRENFSKLVFRIQARFKNTKEFKPGQPISVILK